MNKKGWIRILEAGIAIMLLLGFVYFVTLPTYVKKTSFEKEVYKSVSSILDEIERNQTFREIILIANSALEKDQSLENFVAYRLAEKQLNGKIKICSIDEICTLTQAEKKEAAGKDIFVRERIIAGLPEKDLINKKVAIHAWTTY
ncbi:hypothetical protein B6U80_02240 [Candidatus Pacearchaeota archaeon ex4484_26]|nr:MAG: hypothetical protein B6U80_02240 [Candidatus Pacearchaeota archaeon ex4484_26]